MIESFLVYFSLMCILYGLSRKSEKILHTDNPYRVDISNLLLIACVIIFAFTFGIRWDVGIDHLSYKGVYEKFALGIERRKSLEPGFEYINKFLGLNGFHYSIFFSLLAAIQIGTLLYAFKDRRKIIPFLMIILMSGYFFGWMNIMRQEVVVCIFIWLIVTIEKRSFWNYTFWILFAAFFFHKSALMLIPIYFIIKNRKSYCGTLKFQIIIFLICLCLGYSHFILSHLNRFGEIAAKIGYEQYSSFEDGKVFFQKNYSWGFRTWSETLIAFASILLHVQVKNYVNDKAFISFYNLFFWGTCFALICTGIDVVSRLFVYFSGMSIVVYGYTLYYVVSARKNSSVSNLRYVCYAFLVGLVFIGTMYRSTLPDGHMRYQVFWQHE